MFRAKFLFNIYFQISPLLSHPSVGLPPAAARSTGCLFVRKLATHDDVVDGNVDELDEKPNEAHDKEPGNEKQRGKQG